MLTKTRFDGRIIPQISCTDLVIFYAYFLGGFFLGYTRFRSAT